MQDRVNQVDETSCNARPDHTGGSFSTKFSGFAYRPLPLSPKSERSVSARFMSTRCPYSTHPARRAFGGGVPTRSGGSGPAW